MKHVQTLAGIGVGVLGFCGTALAAPDTPESAVAGRVLGKTSAGVQHLPALRLSAGVGPLVRDLSYVNPVADSYNAKLLPHDKLGLAVPFLNAEWYPGAATFARSGARVGMGLSVAHSALGNTAAYGMDFPTVYQEWIGDVRLAFPQRGVTWIGFAGAGVQRTYLSGDNEVPAGEHVPDAGIMPDVRYNFLRLGALAQVPVSGAWSLLPSAAFRLPSLGGELGEMGEQRWFPQATAVGAEARFVAQGQLTASWSLQLGLSYLFYRINAHSDAQSAIGESGADLVQSVAGGATDQYLQAFLAVSYALGQGVR